MWKQIGKFSQDWKMEIQDLKMRVFHRQLTYASFEWFEFSGKFPITGGFPLISPTVIRIDVFSNIWRWGASTLKWKISSTKNLRWPSIWGVHSLTFRVSRCYWAWGPELSGTSRVTSRGCSRMLRAHWVAPMMTPYQISCSVLLYKRTCKQKTWQIARWNMKTYFTQM